MGKRGPRPYVRHAAQVQTVAYQAISAWRLGDVDRVRKSIEALAAMGVSIAFAGDVRSVELACRNRTGPLWEKILAERLGIGASSNVAG